MKKLLFVLLLVPVLGWAQSPFDGTWKIDLAKAQFPKKPNEYLLKDGMYECKSCKPEIKIKADGQFQPLSANLWFAKTKIPMLRGLRNAVIATGPACHAKCSQNRPRLGQRLG
jgi:hypothetical protein